MLSTLVLLSPTEITGSPVANHMFCLGSRIDPTEKICCGGIVYNKTHSSKEQACCTSAEETVYPKDEKLCCGSQIVSFNTLTREGFESPFCCGGEIFDSQGGTYDKCCGTEFGGIPFKMSKHICCDGKVSERLPRTVTQCCCDKAFDGMKGKCHGDCTVESLWKPTRSCGPINKYKPNTQICCTDPLSNYKVLDRPPGNQNHADYYVLPIWQCYQGQLYDGNKKEVKLYKGESKLLPKANEICGAELFVPGKVEGGKTQKCCDNVLHTIDASFNVHCCGKATYNHDTEECCNGQVLGTSYRCCRRKPYRKGSQACCGGQVINTTSDVCCTDRYDIKSVLKQDRNHTSCCSSGDTHTTYNKYNKACCNGELMDRANQVCCDGVGKVFKQAPDHTTCCPGTNTTYNDSDANVKCCGEHTYDASDNKTGCCGNKVFDTDKYICKKDMVIPKEKLVKPCNCKEGKSSRNPKSACGRKTEFPFFTADVITARRHLLIDVVSLSPDVHLGEQISLRINRKRCNCLEEKQCSQHHRY